MKRLLFVLAAFGFTMACQPVPPPPYVGRGGSIGKCKVITDANYDPGKVGEYMGYFPKTKIEEYAGELGDFSNLGSANINGQFAYTFTISNCACSKVNAWMSQIAGSSEHYKNAYCECPYSPPTKVVKEVIYETPSTTKAPPTPKVVYVEQPPQPQYVFVTPPPPQQQPIYVVTPPPQQQPPVVVYAGAGQPPLQAPPEEICDV